MSRSRDKRFEIRGQRIRWCAPTISGYSCGGLALSIVDICERFQKAGAMRKQVMFSSCASRRSVASPLEKGEG